MRAGSGVHNAAGRRCACVCAYSPDWPSQLHATDQDPHLNWAAGAMPRFLAGSRLPVVSTPMQLLHRCVLLAEGLLVWSSASLSSWASHMLPNMADHLSYTNRWPLRSLGGLIWTPATGARGMRRTGGTAACCCCWVSCRSMMAFSSTAAMLVRAVKSKCLHGSLPRPLQHN